MTKQINMEWMQSLLSDDKKEIIITLVEEFIMELVFLVATIIISYIVYNNLVYQFIYICTEFLV